MSEELKPCPFCAGTAMSCVIVLKDTWRVTCDICYATGPINKDGMIEAIAAWNLRSEPAGKETK